MPECPLLTQSGRWGGPHPARPNANTSWTIAARSSLQNRYAERLIWLNAARVLITSSSSVSGKAPKANTDRQLTNGHFLNMITNAQS
jgi:hypothetical protein